MPYIKQERRAEIDIAVHGLAITLKGNGFEKGDMNYAITKLVQEYCLSRGVSYNTLSDVTGVLNDIKTEFERRVVAPYEDEKIEQNGDAY